MDRKRVLLICYYFPPLGGAGVGRPLTLCRYLPQFGYDCDVLTVKPVAYRLYEPELMHGLDTSSVYRAGSRDPQRLMYLLGIRGVKDKTITRGKKISDRFFPDPKVGWVKPAVNLGRVLAENRNYSCVISTSPPISCHLVGKTLSREFDIPWIADFRDFWTGYKAEDWFESDKQISRAAQLLKDITGEASTVTVVNPAIAEYLHTGEVIYNSYDEQRASLWSQPTDSNQFVIGILGTIDELRPVRPLFELLHVLREKHRVIYDKVKLLQVGSINLGNFHELLDKYGLREKCRVCELQKRQDTIELMSEASVLYISLSSPHGDGVLPGRMFDMMASGRPILAAVSSGSVVENLVRETRNGFCYDDSSITDAATWVAGQVELLTGNKSSLQLIPPYAQRFSSRRMVENFAELITRLSRRSDSAQ